MPMQFESGAASRRMIEDLVIFAVLLAFAGYFFYDWKIGYPEKNRKEAYSKLPVILQDPKVDAKALYDTLSDHPDSDDFDKLIEQKPTTLEQVKAVLGAPQKTRTDGDKEFYYFLGKTGGAAIEIRSGRLQPLVDQSGNKTGAWQNWGKSANDVLMQFYFAFIPLAVSLFFLKSAITAASLKVRMDDQTLDYGGQKIPLASIKAIRDYHPKGVANVIYDENGVEKKLKLDNHRVKRFAELVAEICRAKGFENPMLSAETFDGGASDTQPDLRQ